MRTWAVALIGFVAVAVFGGIAFTLWSNSSTGGPGGQYVFPITWTPAMNPDDIGPASSAITLLDDGTATLTEIALGGIGTNNERPCVSPSGGLYSGKATWTIDQSGYLRLDAEEGTALLVPEAARFEGVDWGSLLQQLCSGDAPAFAARTDRVG